MSGDQAADVTRGGASLQASRTRAIQMATNHPSGYPNFVDISGQLELTLGSRQRTANSLFGGRG